MYVYQVIHLFSYLTCVNLLCEIIVVNMVYSMCSVVGSLSEIRVLLVLSESEIE